MPSRFQTMKCAASEELTTSTAWMRLEYSWPIRWNTRSAPVRSTRTAMPGYLASKALPSFLAASINCGVMAVGGGAAASTLADGVKAPAAIAAEPCRMLRLENVGFFIVASPFNFSWRSVSTAKYPTSLRRQVEPNRRPLRDVLAG